MSGALSFTSRIAAKKQEKCKTTHENSREVNRSTKSIEFDKCRTIERI